MFLSCEQDKDQYHNRCVSNTSVGKMIMNTVTAYLQLLTCISLSSNCQKFVPNSPGHIYCLPLPLDATNFMSWCDLAVCLLVTAILLYMFRTQYDLLRKPSTLDALTGYFTPSHVIHQRLLLQFLRAPEDGRKKRPKHVEYYSSY